MLKKRLAKVEQLITENSLIDIGTDHGYLIIDMLQKKQLRQALAVEVAKGPLENVKSNVSSQSVTNVDFALSDGLKQVSKEVVDKYDAISICGMGGVLIGNIIEQSAHKITTQSLYLQANNNEAKLRAKLNQLGFAIVDETIIIDNEIYYEIIVAKRGEQILSERELYFGKINLAKQTDAFVAKHREQQKHLQAIAEKLEQNEVENQKLMTEIDLLEGILNEIK